MMSISLHIGIKEHRKFINACKINDLAFFKDFEKYVLWEYGDYDYESGFYNACKFNNIKVAEIILKKGGYYCIKNGIYYACRFNRLEIVKLLLDYYYTNYSKNGYNLQIQLGLECAIKYNSKETIIYLNNQ